MGMMQAASAADGAVVLEVEWNDSTRFARRVLTHNTSGQTATARVTQDGVTETYTIPQGDASRNLPNNKYLMQYDAEDDAWRLPVGIQIGLSVP